MFIHVPQRSACSPRTFLVSRSQFARARIEARLVWRYVHSSTGRNPWGIAMLLSRGDIRCGYYRVLRNTLYALLERDGSTLPDILALYTDEKYRREVVRGIKNEVVKRFWTDEFENYPARMRAEACAPIQNKLGALLSDPTLHRILVAPTIDLHFRKLMDEGQILLVNVSKGRLGEQSALVLGSLIVSTIGLAAFSRAETPNDARRPFILYLDEFHNFTTLMLASMMSELRKYGVGLVLAHQYMHQLEPDIRHAVLGNAGTLISFRVGAEDAPYLAKEIQPTFDVADLINLPNYNIYLKLMIDGAPSKPFSGKTSWWDAQTGVQ